MSSTPEANPHQNVTFASNGGQAHGYLRTPESGTGPGVIVIQEWWGLDDHIASLVDRLSGEGFVALAPDLYGGRVAHDSDDAGAMMQALSDDQAVADLSGAVDFLLADEAVTSRKVGALGFCMGGGFVLKLAAAQGDLVGAAVPFYGFSDNVAGQYSAVTAAVQGHYGEKDEFYPVEKAHALEQQLKDESSGSVEFFYYDAGHAFNNEKDRMGTYDPEAATLAWTRAVAFLHEQLG
jgi:carboxymethylenebutenolidase